MIQRFIAITIVFIAAGVMPGNAQTMMSRERGEQLYQAGSPPKAFATSSNGHWGFATSADASSLADAKAKALGYCAQFGGVTCSVTRSQGK
jgi:hypothetical protein